MVILLYYGACGLRILLFTLVNPTTGLGHWTRTIALLKEAKNQDHSVALASNCSPMTENLSYNIPWYLARNEQECLYASAQWRPHWIVVDLPEAPTEGFFREAQAKTLLLNGVGHHHDERHVTLVVIQGFPKVKPKAPNVLYGADYVILRPEVFRLKRQPKDYTLVYGGASDSLELCRTFSEYCPETKAKLVKTIYGSAVEPMSPNHQVVDLNGGRGIDFLSLLSECDKLVAHTGMTMWEAAGMGVPTYLFSRSEEHLYWAKQIEKAKLALVYPSVGLPSIDAFRRFISQPFKPMGHRPDSQASTRILSAMEKMQ